MSNLTKSNLLAMANILKLKRLGYTDYFIQNLLSITEDINKPAYTKDLQKSLNLVTLKLEYNRVYSDIMFIHSAAIFSGTLTKTNILSIGENKISCCGDRSTHAEMDAINKLITRKNKKIMRVNVLVIRTTKSFTLGNSYPCALCIKYLYERALQKGYAIDKIYYSTAEGTIECSKFNDMIMGQKQIFSCYYRNNNINQKKFMKWRDHL